jgi:hypothetical protein
LRHIPLVAVYSVHHELQRGIYNRAGFFGIQTLDQCGRAFEVGKEGSNGLALTVRSATCLQRRLFGADALG